MPQPQLPELVQWPELTAAWWDAWGKAPGAEYVTETDWLFLTDTALLHASIWGSGDMSRMGELRARVAAFEEKLTERSKASGSTESKGTALDEFSKRLAARGAKATRRAGS